MPSGRVPLLVALLPLTALLAAGRMIIAHDGARDAREAMTERVIYDGDPAERLNPERGWMVAHRGADPREGSLRLDDTDRPQDYADVARAARLAYAGVRLDHFGKAARDFRARDLDEPMLGQLQTGFDRVRAAGFKVVLRFSYNDPANFPAVIDADAPEPVILRHISQLAPLLARNADVIALLEAGFIGAWGEWHSSTNCLTADLGDPPAIAQRCQGQAAGAAAARRRIMDALLTAVPAPRSIAVRQPRFRVEQVGARRAAEDRFSASPSSRIGFHDDCLLASDSDMGTFAAPFPAALLPKPAGADDIAAWRDYAARETEVVPFGGETCRPIAPSTGGAVACDQAKRRLRELHTSFLNSSYYQPTLEIWRREGCHDEIGRHLGYALQAIDARWSEETSPGGAFRLDVQLRNQGYAAPLNARPLRLIVDDGAHAFVAELAADLRTLLPPGQTRRFVVTLAVPAGAPPGPYQMFLWLPDPAPGLAARPEYSVRLGNARIWREQGRAAGMNALTTKEQPLVVRKARPGRTSKVGGDAIPLEPFVADPPSGAARAISDPAAASIHLADDLGDK